MSLVSLSEMKDYVGIASGDTSQDVFLQAQLDLISDAIEGYCRRRFVKTTWSEMFYKRSAESRVLSLFHYPVIDIVSIAGFADYSQYRLHKPTGRLEPKCGIGLWSDLDEIEIIYTAGFETVPSPIRAACLSLVQERYNKKKSGVDLNFGSDVQRVSIPGTISIDFDYSLDNNSANVKFGSILGSQQNIIGPYASDRAIVMTDRLAYIEKVI